MGVTLTVPALWSDVPANFVPDLPGTRKKVAYSNSSPSNGNAADCVNKVYAAILANPGTAADPTNVLAWSMGSQGVDKLLREKGADLLATGVAPNTLHFYLCGDPEHKFNGASVLAPGRFPAVYPGTTGHSIFCPAGCKASYHGGYGVGYGLPPNCAWYVDCLVMGYDGWCDFENDQANQLADMNAKYGRTNYPGPHQSYGSFLLNDANTGVYHETATVTYRYRSTYPMPLYANSGKPASEIAVLDAHDRPTIERGYARPPYAFGSK